jgi:hypothetical protein
MKIEYFLFYSHNLKLVNLMVYVILHYLIFLKDMLILTLYISLETQILNIDHKINSINFI